MHLNYFPIDVRQSSYNFLGIRYELLMPEG